METRIKVRRRMRRNMKRLGGKLPAGFTPEKGDYDFATAAMWPQGEVSIGECSARFEEVLERAWGLAIERLAWKH